MSFVSFTSSLKCLLSNKSACSISCLSTVKKHIYHPLYILYKTHNTADKELTPYLGWNRVCFCPKIRISNDKKVQFHLVFKAAYLYPQDMWQDRHMSVNPPFYPEGNILTNIGWIAMIFCPQWLPIHGPQRIMDCIYISPNECGWMDFPNCPIQA